jgi:AcrR family transcriptional regulator
MSRWNLVTSPDTDIWDRIPSDGARRIAMAALETFADVGYRASSTRAIAERAGLSNAAVFFHYSTKEELLFAISRAGHEAVLEAVVNAVDEADGPRDRLRAFVGTAATWHAEHHMLARVIQYELNGLTAAHHAEVVDLRRRFEGNLRKEITAGVAAGLLATHHVEGTLTAILSLCIDVARWYRPERAGSPGSLGALYADLALLMLGAGAP